MATRSRLYTRFHSTSTNQNEDKANAINLVILNNNVDESLINDVRIKIKVFTEENIDSWFDYITTGITNVYLVVPNIFSNVMLQSICEYPQIKYIYILSEDFQYENYSGLHGKLRGTFHQLSEIVKQLQADIKELPSQFYSEQSTFQNIDAESSQILWWSFFDRVLQNITYTNTAMDEFIHFCTTIYRNEPRELRQIEEFKKDYNGTNAIWWYTKPGFLYLLLNETLRTSKSLDDIFKFRFFIKDLVCELRNAQVDLCKISDFTIYRAQKMRYEEIKQLQSRIGQVIFINSFLSTTLVEDVARMFAECIIEDSLVQGVLMTLRIEFIDNKMTSIPFALISSFSAFEEEAEVLFSPHSTFLIESVEFNKEEKLWHVHLKYVDNLWNIDFGERSIFSPHAEQIFIRNLSNENKQFIAFQLLLDMILRLDHNQYAKKELLVFSRFKYQDDPIKLKQIDDFEQNYCSKDPAMWYTKDSFLYRLLNESLRIETVDSIVKMRYYISDLHNQLAQQQLEQFNHRNNLILYRGVPMKIDQVNEIRENYDGYISFNSFTSVTEDQNVAIMFSGDGVATSSNEVSVVFQISVDTSIRTTPFAKIESINPDEQEILFSMGAVFRIGNIKEIPDHPKVQCIQLKLEYVEDELWNKLTKHFD